MVLYDKISQRKLKHKIDLVIYFREYYSVIVNW